MTDSRYNGRPLVHVSKEYARLRADQDALNKFMWSSEIALLHSSSRISEEAGPDVDLHSVLGGLGVAHAWVLNGDGRLKYNPSIADYLTHASCSSALIFELAIGRWFSIFEQFLYVRVGQVFDDARDEFKRFAHDGIPLSRGKEVLDVFSRRSSRRGLPGPSGWGPFYCTLAIPALSASGGAHRGLRLMTVLCADLIREIRNAMTHDAGRILVGRHEAEIIAWRKRTVAAIRNDWGYWCSDSSASAEDMANGAIDFVLGSIEKELASARTESREVPPGLLAAIFAFSNLDRLAFEVEEALLPIGFEGAHQVRRYRRHLRRDDLAVEGSDGAEREET